MLFFLRQINVCNKLWCKTLFYRICNIGLDLLEIRWQVPVIFFFRKHVFIQLCVAYKVLALKSFIKLYLRLRRTKNGSRKLFAFSIILQTRQPFIIFIRVVRYECGKSSPFKFRTSGISYNMYNFNLLSVM